jgi:sulfur carrier protein
LGNSNVGKQKIEAYLRVGFFVGSFMIININGKETDVAGNIALQQLIIDRKLNQKQIIIELNGLVLKPNLWGSTVLSPNDKLEIIRIIGGG